MTPTATLPAVPEATEIENQLMTLSDRAIKIVVTNDSELMAADAIKSECLAMRKTVTEFFKPLKQAAHLAHKKLTDAESAELSKIVPGEDHVKSAMATYQMEQKKKREAEEARLLKEAHDREEAERLERAAQIEREAAALKAAGHIEEAESVQEEAVQVMNTPAYVPPPRMAPVPKTKNVLRMIVDSDRLQTVCASLNRKIMNIPPVIPGVTFTQVWQYEVYSPASVPDAWRKPS